MLRYLHAIFLRLLLSNLQYVAYQDNPLNLNEFQEDPGESLSDCEDKEDDVDKIDNEGDEDSADGFVVPDGYLSDSEVWIRF